MTKQAVIGFSAPKSFKIGAKLIQLWMGGTPYSHAYIKLYSSYTGLNLVYQASHGHVNCIEYINFCESNKVIAEFELDVEAENIRSTVIRLQQLLQKPYGVIGLAKLVFCKLLGMRKIGDGESTFHCSELVARIEPKILELSTQKDPDLIEPVHAYNALKLMNAKQIK